MEFIELAISTKNQFQKKTFLDIGINTTEPSTSCWIPTLSLILPRISEVSTETENYILKSETIEPFKPYHHY